MIVWRLARTTTSKAKYDCFVILLSTSYSILSSSFFFFSSSFDDNLANSRGCFFLGLYFLVSFEDFLSRKAEFPLVALKLNTNAYSFGQEH